MNQAVDWLLQQVLGVVILGAIVLSKVVGPYWRTEGEYKEALATRDARIALLQREVRHEREMRQRMLITNLTLQGVNTVSLDLVRENFPQSEPDLGGWSPSGGLQPT